MDDQTLTSQAREVLTSTVQEGNYSGEHVCPLLYALILLEEWEMVDRLLQEITVDRKGVSRLEGEEISSIEFIRVMGLLFYQREDVKTYAGKVKRLLKYVQNHFDEQHLLIYSPDKTSFSTWENLTLLSELDGLTHGLNAVELYREADQFFMIKGKLELGIHRYLWHPKEQALLRKFTPGESLALMEDHLEMIEFMNRYHVDEEVHAHLVQKVSKESIQKEKDMKTILNLSYALRKHHPKKFQEFWKKHRTLISYFPVVLMDVSNFERLQRIEVSVLGEMFTSGQQLPKRKEVIIHSRNPLICAQTVEVLLGE